MSDILHIHSTRLTTEQSIASALPAAAPEVVLTGDDMSVAEFEEKLLSQYVPAEAIGEVENWLLLHDAVTAEPRFRKDAFLSGLPGSDGFIPCVGDLIQQIKLGLVTGSELASINGFAPGKEEWVKRLFKRYERSVKKQGLFDSADRRIELIKKLSTAKSPPVAIVRYKELHFHDVYHFTPFRFELLYLLGRWTKIVVRFPLPDDRRKVFDFVERNIQKFQSLEDESGGIELEFDPVSPVVAAPLDKFSSTIFDEENRPPLEGSPGNSLEIIKNSSRYREIEEAAERILESKGARDWSDFCLVFRNLEQYGVIVEDVFRRAGIPVYLRRGIPVKANPYVKAVLSIFRAIETDFDRDEVVKIATSDYFSFLPAPVAAHSFEKMAMEAGIINGPPPLWKKRLARLKVRKAKMRGRAAAVKKLLALLTAMEKLAKKGRALECVTAFESVVKILNPKPLRQSDRFSIRDYYCRARFESVLREVRRALSRHSLRTAQFTWQDLRRLLLNSLGNLHTPDWSDKNHVYALNVHELAGLSFPYLFICGLHDGEFPKAAESGSILTEAEKKEFNKCHAEAVLAKMPKKNRGRQIFTRMGESWDEESFLFYLAIRSARVKLHLSYSTNDLNGEELKRSGFLDDVKEAIPDVKETATQAVAIEKDYFKQLDSAARESKLLRDLFRKPLVDAGELREYFLNLAGRKGAGRSFLLSCERSRIELGRADFYLEFDPAVRREKATRFTGKVDGKKSAALRGFFRTVAKNGYSPTSLERYANCGFRYFMEKVLECEPLKFPRADAERTAQGSVIHEVLERYYTKVKTPIQNPRLPNAGAALKIINRCAKDVFVKWETQTDIGNERLWEVTKAQITAALKLFIQNEEANFLKEPFAVIDTEFGFGTGKNSVNFTIDGRRINLRGSIDRVDYLPRKRLLRVIDYKHTASVATYSRLLLPENFCIESFQVPIYLFAALSLIGKDGLLRPGLLGGYGAYYALKKVPKFSARAVKASAFDDLAASGGLDSIAQSDEFGGRILALVRRMEEGDFSVTPKDCIFCRYGGVCRYQEVRKVETHE